MLADGRDNFSTAGPSRTYRATPPPLEFIRSSRKGFWNPGIINVESKCLGLSQVSVRHTISIPLWRASSSTSFFLPSATRLRTLAWHKTTIISGWQQAAHGPVAGAPLVETAEVSAKLDTGQDQARNRCPGQLAPTVYRQKSSLFGSPTYVLVEGSIR